MTDFLRIDIIDRLLQVKGFLKFSSNTENYHVNNKRKSGIYVNVKTIWNYPWIVDQIAGLMSDSCYGSDYIIGIETGGSPFAVKIASQLNLPFGLARKESTYLKQVIAGTPEPFETYSLTIVDDVLGSGASLRKVLDYTKGNAKRYRLVTLVSYGMDNELEAIYPNLQIRSVFKVEDLVERLDSEDKKLATKALNEYKQKLKKALNEK